MRMLKKGLVGLLAVGMLITNSGFVQAKNYVDVPERYEKAVTRLSAVNVLNGYVDGSFKLDNTVTRAEMAAVVVRMLGKEGLAKSRQGQTRFVDIENGSWAEGYVNVAVSEGIIRGYADGTFRPEAPVSYAEAITMMVRAIGAGQVIGSFGVWPDNYIEFASREGLTDEVYFVKEEDATRGDIAILAENTLSARMWKVSEEIVGDEVKIVRPSSENEDTLYANNLKIKVIRNKKIEKQLGDLLKPNKFIASGESYEFRDGAEDQVMIGQEVDIWVDGQEEVVIVEKAKDSGQKLLEFENVVRVENDEIRVRENDGKNKNYQVSPMIKYYINGEEKAKTDIQTDRDLKGYMLVNKDNIVDYVSIIDYNRVLVVDDISIDESENKVKINGKNQIYSVNEIINLDLDREYVHVEGVRDIYKTNKNNLILYSNNKKYLKVLPRNVERGYVKRVNDRYIQIDRKRYNFNEEFANNLPLYDIRVGDALQLYLDDQNDIVIFEKLDMSDVVPRYGVIIDFYAYKKINDIKNGAKIELLDLETGEFTAKRDFDAKETDDQGRVFSGEDFYDEEQEDIKLNDDLKKEYESYIGEVVRYILDNGEIILFEVDRSEYKEDLTKDSEIDTENTQVIVNDREYSIREHLIKVYQAMGVDNYRLKINEVQYQELVDNKNCSMIFVDKKKQVQIVYFPLVDDDDYDEDANRLNDDMYDDMQILNKVNDTYTGEITRIRKFAEDVEVEVDTKEGRIRFYVEEFYADRIKTDGGRAVLSEQDDWKRFIGKTITYGTNDSDYVTIENIKSID